MTVEAIKKKINPILKRHGVKRAAVFGSYAHGEQKRSSDVDILIEYEHGNKSLFDLIDLENELKQALKKKVDLLTYDGIYHRLRERILKSQKIIL